MFILQKFIWPNFNFSELSFGLILVFRIPIWRYFNFVDLLFDLIFTFPEYHLP